MATFGEKLHNLYVELEIDPSGLNGIGKAVDDALTKSGKLRNFGKSLTRNVTAPLLAVGGLATKAFGSFDSALNQSLSIMDETAQAMRGEMAEAARAVSDDVTTSSTEAAEAYYYLASAGLSARESIASLPDVARFAQAGMFDMARATDLATDAQSALGLSMEDPIENAEQMRRVMDTLVRANQLANASVEQFSESLTNRAATALRNANREVEEGVALLALYADQGIKGQRAGMLVSQMLRYMSQAAAENRKEFENLGLVDAEGNLASFSDIARIMTRELAGLGDAARTARLKQLGFNARVQAAILPMLGASDAIAEYENSLRSAGGASAEVARNQLRSPWEQLKLTRNAVVNAAQALGKRLMPAVTAMSERVRALAKAFTELPGDIQTAVAAAGAFAAAVGPVLIGLGAIAPLVANAVALFGTFAGAAATTGRVVSGLAGGSFKPLLLAMRPVLPLLKSAAALLSGPLAAGLGAAAAATHFVYTRWDDLVGVLSGPAQRVWRALSATVTSVMDAVGGSVGGVLAEVEALWESAFGDAVVAAIGAVAEVVSRGLAVSIRQLGNVVETVATTIGNAIGMIGDLLRGDFSGAFEHARDQARNALGFIQREFEAVTGAGERELSDLEKAAYVAFQDMQSHVGVWAGGVRENAESAWRDFADAAGEAWSRVREVVAAGAASAWEAIKENLFGPLPEIIADTADVVGTWATELASKIRERVGGAVDTVKSKVDELAGEYDVRFRASASGPAAAFLLEEGAITKQVALKLGWSEDSGAATPDQVVSDTTTELTELQKKLREVMSEMRSGLSAVAAKAEFWNKPLQGARDSVEQIRSTINRMLEEGMEPSSAQAARLRDRLGEAKERVLELTRAMAGMGRISAAEVPEADLPALPDGYETTGRVDPFGPLADKLGVAAERIREYAPAIREQLSKMGDVTAREAGIMDRAFKQIQAVIKRTMVEIATTIAKGVGEALGSFARFAVGVGSLREVGSALKEMGRGILKSLAGAMQQIGGILVTAGTAFAALGGPGGLIAAILSNPFTAIGAGLALSAVGTGLDRVASSTPKPVGGGGSRSPGRSSTSRPYRTHRRDEQFSLQTRLDGNDILIALERTQARRNR